MMARRKPRASATRRLHRSLGAGAAVFLIFMVISGLVINHSNSMGLDKRHLSQPSLLSWYGLDEPEQIDSFAVGTDWLSFAGSQLYLNGKPVSSLSNGVGAVSSNKLIIAAGSDELLLLDPDGQLIERQSWSLIGATSIESIGLLPGSIVVVKSENRLWLADADLLNWHPSEDTNTTPAWSLSEPAPGLIREAIARQYRGEGPSLERVLLDFHSGRIFGPIGIVVYDLLALVVLFLSISGLIIWIRGKRNGTRNGKRQH
jgi:hypothetical protein